MKLLIITQKVDKTDPILGFFHKWIDEFASHCDSVTVVGQQVGSHQLAENVEVISLEKERGRKNISQIIRFWKIIWSNRKEYDSVLVHMTPVWILIGAPLWIVLRKPMYLWYEIKRGSWKLTASLFFVKKVFAASEHGLPTIAKKQKIVGHGIDTDTFVPQKDLREPKHLVAIGRLTKVKHYEVILKALSTLDDCRLTIAGGTITSSDKEEEKRLRDLMHRLNIADRVEIGWVSPEDIPQLLQRADVMLHASQGGLDKVVLQAMSCGCPVVSTSEAAIDELPESCCANERTMSAKVDAITRLGNHDRDILSEELRKIVSNEHSLKQCISEIVTHMNS
ncbi:MAG: glycosyltransferase family 4 protein [Candidatus Peribacter sp.]|nr:glycosyltransferase family 4 protein [Candidatus Peribacter sp.]